MQTTLLLIAPFASHPEENVLQTQSHQFSGFVHMEEENFLDNVESGLQDVKSQIQRGLNAARAKPEMLIHISVIAVILLSRFIYMKQGSVILLSRFIYMKQVSAKTTTRVFKKFNLKDRVLAILTVPFMVTYWICLNAETRPTKSSSWQVVARWYLIQFCSLLVVTSYSMAAFTGTKFFPAVENAKHELTDYDHICPFLHSVIYKDNHVYQYMFMSSMLCLLLIGTTFPWTDRIDSTNVSSLLKYGGAIVYCSVLFILAVYWFAASVQIYRGIVHVFSREKANPIWFVCHLPFLVVYTGLFLCYSFHATSPVVIGMIVAVPLVFFLEPVLKELLLRWKLVFKHPDGHQWRTDPVDSGSIRGYLWAAVPPFACLVGVVITNLMG